MSLKYLLSGCLFMLSAYHSVPELYAGDTLTWITRLGSDTASETNRRVAVAASGNTYLIGSSNESFGTPLSAHNGGSLQDILLAKFNSDGILQWHTFIGSTVTDFGQDIAFDADENIYITGSSSDNFGTPVNPHAGNRPQDPVNSDILVAKFDSAGALLWHTFHGIGQENIFGGENDVGYAIDLDATGNVYVTGISDGTWGDPIWGFEGGQNVPQAVVLKLNNSGVLQWHTFHGGEGASYGWDIETDRFGSQYVSGRSFKTWGSPQEPHSTNGDAHIFKLNTNGELQWNTFSNGAGGAFALALSHDERDIFITGGARSAWDGDAVNPHNGNVVTDIVVARYDRNGNKLWQTFHGASAGDDVGTSIVRRGGNLYVTAASEYSWGSPVDPKASPDETYCGVALELSESGALLHQSFQCGEAGIDSSGITSGHLFRTTSGALNLSLQPLIGGVSHDSWGSPISDFTGTGIFLAQLDFPVRAEIQVEGENLVIENGDTTPRVVDGTDFRNTPINSGTVVQEFIVVNLGSGELELSGTPKVDVLGAHSADFSINMQPSSPIAIKTETTFEVTFHPSVVGLRSATLSIASNDEDENAYSFDIQGTGLPPQPEMVVRGNGIEIDDGESTATIELGTDFGIKTVKSFSTHNFVIENIGSIDLELTSSTKVSVGGLNASDFAVSPQPDSPIPAGTDTSFGVRFNPQEAGIRTAFIRINNNDADEHPYTFVIEGEGEMGFTMGGTIVNLQGLDLLLDSGNGQQWSNPFPGGTTFEFYQPVLDGTTYDITVASQPTNPGQVCTVQNGSGTIAGANVTDVVVTCGSNFTVGGTLTGLIGPNIQLVNNCTDFLDVTTDGPFEFPAELDDGSPYSVTVVTQPESPPQLCAVIKGSGNIDGANVTNIQVVCDSGGLILMDSFESVASCP